MAAPLNTCTTIEQRGVVWFLWAKGMAAKDIHKEMLPMYGEHCLSHQAVHNWVQKFSEGRTSIEEGHRVGRHCSRGSDSDHKNFTPQVSGDLWNVGTSVYICMEITLKNKYCLYVIISIRFFSITISDLLTDFPLYMRYLINHGPLLG